MRVECCTFSLITTLCLMAKWSAAMNDMMTIEDFSNSHTILLPYGKERTIKCGDPLLSDSHVVRWYFGDVRSLWQIHFDANGRFVSFIDSSQFHLVDASGYAIVVRASGDSSDGPVQFNFGDPSDQVELVGGSLVTAVGPNGILACSRANHRPPITIFHLMTVLVLRAPAFVPGGGCPVPGYRLGSYAGQAACYPCLPGEDGSNGADCRPCPDGFESRGFASSRCVPVAAVPDDLYFGLARRVRRSANANATAVSATNSGVSGTLKHKRLPLASFTAVIMYHFLLVLMLSAIVFLFLFMAALSFDTVWCGVLSETETGIATVLDDRFVLDQPEPENDPDSD